MEEDKSLDSQEEQEQTLETDTEQSTVQSDTNEVIDGLKKQLDILNSKLDNLNKQQEITKKVNQQLEKIATLPVQAPAEEPHWIEQVLVDNFNPRDGYDFNPRLKLDPTISGAYTSLWYLKWKMENGADVQSLERSNLRLAKNLKMQKPIEEIEGDFEQIV